MEGYDPLENRKVAIKRVRKAEKKISREYQILSELRDAPHCVQLLDFFYTSKGKQQNKITQNFVFEYLPNNLENYICSRKKQRKFIPFITIQKIMSQMLVALENIHEKGICHRDIKPDNILVDENLNIKICDFGSSKKMLRETKKNLPRMVSRYYRAPELICSHTDYSFAIDIWAAACIFLEMFSREPIFPGENDGLQILEIMAILGPPTKSDKEILYKFLEKRTIEKIESVEDDFQKKDLKEIIPKRVYSRKIAEIASDLAEKMLKWNPLERLSAKEALNHEFFNCS